MEGGGERGGWIHDMMMVVGWLAGFRFLDGNCHMHIHTYMYVQGR